MDQCFPHLLFLCHRIPYPPDKGDKIRSYRWLQELLKHFHVHLGAFIDDPADWAHVAQLRDRCASSLFLPLDRNGATFRSLSGLFSGTALTIPYYRDVRMQRWALACRIAHGIEHVLVFSSAMAQYAENSSWSTVRRVIDFVDVDSDKWRQYAHRKRGPAALVFRREAKRLAKSEARLAHIFDASVFVSDHEADLFRRCVGDVAERVLAIRNGVDTSYFNAVTDRVSPYPVLSEPVVFTGVMDYWTNVDAVLWLVREVWPMVKEKRPRALFVIVGAKPTPEVLRLCGEDVWVTGRVVDVRPYLQYAAVVVAPMRIARGVQNKVLEGMAMGRPVVVTSKGLEGIAAVPGRDVLVADEPAAYAREIVAVWLFGISVGYDILIFQHLTRF
ncbi:TIGR03087 family PEP-CTERM/XrtA system glycosyltransferase [uncultured Lamprocystis sp.]|jgi:sugar transferase (PEP-CTERM/EpsH1 system associated)|uniref:TIGR03087 family PEP-CTERM/XrtA system glycosyltransferase n=1 Tax=uncultured Lamprocystis sp. TaxID=543132 RepID=UPI0025E4B5DE|nr:TIGR03087 family PEP-CTERM/XrtA system glycosyltransferase [uncultured Lamprocystis sp.]